MKEFSIEEKISSDKKIQRAAREGNVDLVNYFLEKYPDSINYAIIGICEGNHDDKIHLINGSKKGDESAYLIGAGKSHNLNIIKKFINISSPKYVIFGASRGGHFDLVKEYFDSISEWDQEDLDWCLFQAGRGGNKEIIRFFLDKGAKNTGLAMMGAVKGEKIVAVNFLKKVTPPEAIADAIRMARERNSQEIIDSLL